MTPKQKAEKLWWDYYSAIEHTLSEEYSPHESAIAKQCALIAVDEIIPIVESYEDALSASQKSDELLYWEEVKQEIEKL